MLFQVYLASDFQGEKQTVFFSFFPKLFIREKVLSHRRQSGWVVKGEKDGGLRVVGDARKLLEAGRKTSHPHSRQRRGDDWCKSARN